MAAKKKSSIFESDPLGGTLGKSSGGDSDVVDDVEAPGVDDGLGSAQALLDAIHAKDAAGVRDAFSALSLTMTPPGEDDMDMSPSDAAGSEFPSLDE